MSIKGRIHSVETFGTVDGPGIRYIIFLQGCPLRCKYCHNRDTWSLNGGREVSVDEVLSDIKKYIPFMTSSGGGVTISGGEPTLQMEFLITLLKELKLLGIHTALDTSGFVEITQIKELIEYVDLVLLDIKHMDSLRHQWLTGFSNEKILAFAKFLSDNRIPMWIRHVVVPTITDNELDVRALAKFIDSLESVSRVEILPYHSMGKYKWSSLNLAYPLEGIRDAKQPDIERVYRIFEEFNVIQKVSVVA